MSRRWCHCGAPLWRPAHSMWEGKFCQVCWLVSMTSQQVVWDEQERQGYTAEGEAIGSVMVWSTMGEPGFDPAPFNSTDDTAATSRWSPCNGPRVPCNRCQCCDDTVYKRSQNTAYNDEESNYAVLCSECQVEADAMWQDQWDEYYAGLA